MNARPLIAVLVFAPLAAGFNLVRDPDSPRPIVWQVPMVTMKLQQDGSKDITDGSALTAIRNALVTWNAVPCSAFRFADGGTIASRAVTQDGTNVITWIETNWPGAAAGAGAYTTRYLDASSPKHWIEADISINGQEYTWGTDGDVHKVDVQGVVLHELGHVMGFAHSVNPQAVMYFRAQGGTTYARTLDGDELAGVCFLYPTGSFSCTRDQQCPLYWGGGYGGMNLQTHCAQGACVAGGSSAYGAACFLDGDCTSGHCALDPMMPPTTEPGFCTMGCTPGTAGTCPNGDYCHMEAPMPRCYIGRDDCTVDADCAAHGRNWVCDRDLDGRNRCRHLCLENANCAGLAGTVCHGGTGTNPPGFCRVPGPKTEGERCKSGLECQSLTCTEGGPLPTCAAGTPGFQGDGGPVPDAGLRDAVAQDDMGSTAADGGASLGDASSAEDDGPSSAGVTTGHCGCASARSARAPSTGTQVIGLVLGLLVAARTRVSRSGRRLPRHEL